MAKTRAGVWIVLVVLVLMSCGEKQGNNEASTDLKAIIDTVENFKLYNRKEHPLGRFEKALYKKDADFASRQLERLSVLDSSQLSETELISWELLKFKLQERVDFYVFEMYLNPIQADQGFHLDLNYRVKPIRSYQDAKDYLKLLQDIPHFVDQNLLLIKLGIEKGISQPKVIFNGYESTYNDHIVSNYKDSYFYQPFESLPELMSLSQKEAVRATAKIVIEKSVVPSFQKIKEFFESQYIPNTREAIGVSQRPGGEEFYQNRINYYTTTNTYTADKIHQLGLQEVSRIKSEMQKIIKKLEFDGSFEEFLEFLRTDPQFYVNSADELLKQARDISKRIDAQLPKYFKILPRKPYGVIKVPDAIAPKYTGGRYSGNSNSTEPGYYLVNTYKLDSRPLYNLPALTAHEAVPGHHLQGSLNQELGDSIPEFRRHTYLSAYGEGWALYCEYLADEMGIYTSPYEEFGKLTYEMWRACRLVVDTGIHAKGWTRLKVVNYLKSNTALSEHEVNTETDRYIAWPAQAISYKVGELKIRELRALATQKLGADFDIRAFHELILEQGTVTLPIMERRVRNYIDKQAKEYE